MHRAGHYPAVSEQARLILSAFHSWLLQDGCLCFRRHISGEKEEKGPQPPVAFTRKAKPSPEPSQQTFAHISWARSMSHGPSYSVSRKERM